MGDVFEGKGWLYTLRPPCRRPLSEIESHVRVQQTHLNIVPFWKTFVTGKMSSILSRGWIVTFQIPQL